jgi:energy-coupling factor transporter ATP-binding protein EcfA2
MTGQISKFIAERAAEEKGARRHDSVERAAASTVGTSEVCGVTDQSQNNDGGVGTPVKKARPTQTEVGKKQGEGGDGLDQMGEARKLDMYKSSTDGNTYLRFCTPTGRFLSVNAASGTASGIVQLALSKQRAKPLSRPVAENVIALKAAMVATDGPNEPTYRRIAPGHMDLNNEDGEVARFEPHVQGLGVSVITDAQAGFNFIRTQVMGAIPKPLPMPVRAAFGVIDPLLKRFGIAEPEDRLLVMVLLVECVRYGTPKPGLQVCGPQGSGKTTAAVNLANIVDPTASLKRGATKLDEPNVMAAVHQYLVLNFDNIRRLTADEQDLLCKVITGWVLAARKLYEQSVLAQVHVQNPVFLSVISPVVTASDLLSRIVTVFIKARPGGTSEEEITDFFKLNHQDAISAIASMLSAALYWIPIVKPQRAWALRLVDFTQLGEAICQALGHQPGYFYDILNARQQRASLAVATDDPLVSNLLDILGKLASKPAASQPSTRSWVSSSKYAAWTAGTATVVVVMLSELQAKLITASLGPTGREAAWAPNSTRALHSAILHREPTFKALGLAVSFKEIGKAGGARALVVSMPTPRAA